jgi:glycine cleavage system aminomethyltransferase T
MTDLSGAVRASPLHALWSSLSRSNAWSAHGGLTVPEDFGDPDAERHAVQFFAGIGDISHWVAYTVSGREADAFLLAALCAPDHLPEPGDCAPAAWCDDQGFVRGEGHVFHRRDGTFAVATPTPDLDWFAAGAKGFDAQVSLFAGRWAGVAVAGPKAQMTYESLSAEGRGAERLWDGAPILTAGLPGLLRLFLPAEAAPAFVRYALARCGQHGLRAAGRAALTAHRVEQFILEPGTDWRPRQSGDTGRRAVQLGYRDPGRACNGRAPAFSPPDESAEAMVLAVLDQAPPHQSPWTSVAPAAAQSQLLGLGWVPAAQARPGTMVAGGRLLQVLATESVVGSR